MNKITFNARILEHYRDKKVQRNFLEQFLDKISKFPQWVKEIIYNELSAQVDEDNNFAYVFAAYKPVLTYKGKCELDYKNSNFDTNIYNILDACDKNMSISQITINTFLSLEEAARYFILCVDEGYLELPDNSQILNIAGYLAGKYRTGEYFVKDGSISDEQLESAVSNYRQNSSPDKKFGQSLVKMGFVSEKRLNKILSFKQEAKQRIILDYNEVPQIKQEYTKSSDKYEKQIQDLKEENKNLRKKLNQLLTMVSSNE